MRALYRFIVFYSCTILLSTPVLSQNQIALLRMDYPILPMGGDVLRPSPGKKPWYIGIEGGINYNMFSQDMTLTPPLINTPTEVLKKGSGISPFFAVGLDIPISDQLGFQAKLSYDQKSWKNTKSGVADCDLGGYLRDFPEEMEWDVTANYIGIALLLRADATKELFFTVGPVFHFLSGDPTQDLTIRTLDETCLLLPDLVPEMKFTSDISEAKSTRVGLEAGIGYRIWLTPTIFMAPQGRIQYLLTPFASDYIYPDFDGTRLLSNGFASDAEFTNRKLFSFQFALSFWFQI